MGWLEEILRRMMAERKYTPQDFFRGKMYSDTNAPDNQFNRLHYPGGFPENVNMTKFDEIKDLVNGRGYRPSWYEEPMRGRETQITNLIPSPILQQLMKNDLDTSLNLNVLSNYVGRSGQGMADYDRMGQRGLPDADRLQVPGFGVGKPM